MMGTSIAEYYGPVDLLNIVFDDLKKWSLENDYFLDKIFRPFATIPGHLLCAALAVPAAIIYEFALTIFHLFAALFTFNHNHLLEALQHCYSFVRIPGCFLSHLFAAIVPWIVYADFSFCFPQPTILPPTPVTALVVDDSEVKQMREIADNWLNLGLSQSGLLELVDSLL